MLKNILFDFDGVIGDTIDMNWAICQEVAEPATFEDFIAHHDGNVFEEPRIKFNPNSSDLFHTRYRETLFPHHVDAASGPLKRLVKQYALFIVTSNSEHSVNQVLEETGLNHLFTRVMGLETHKSKIEKFTILKNEYGITSENAVFITDTLGDVREANKAGIRTIAETFGYHDRERLSQANPFKIADSWEEIEDIIAEL